MQSQQTQISSIENNNAITIALAILKECRKNFIETIVSNRSSEHFSLLSSIVNFADSNSMTYNYMAFCRSKFSMRHFEILNRKEIEDNLKLIVSQKLANLLLKIKMPITNEYATKLIKQNDDIFTMFLSEDTDLKLKMKKREYEDSKREQTFKNLRKEYLTKKKT